MKTAYTRLEETFKRLHILGDAQGILHWDMSAMMPQGGAASRAEQLAVLSTIRHGLISDPVLADNLQEAEENKNRLDDWQKANLREMRRAHTHATALDEELVEALSRSTSKCEQVWREARKENDFKKIVPYLKEVLSLTRTSAVRKAEKLGVSLYDALLDQYEPDGRSKDIDEIFTTLEEVLPSLLTEVLEKQKDRTVHVPEGPFAIEKQKELGVFFMKALGFDFNHGRLDVSLHPFCGGTADDVRLTTRYDEADFTSSLMGVLHETGHALYERGLPEVWRYQPVGQARGMSVHESQSLLVEMQLCRSEAFLKFAFPHLKKMFQGSGVAWNEENFKNLYHQVQPGFIRVDADEVTYPAHVILRYKMERALIEGRMEVEDIPSTWNGLMQQYLGITPPSDRDGCLQDIHWYDGAWGYFPTYTLGAMSAAQIFASLSDQLADVENQIRNGHFKGIMEWLSNNIHSKGSFLSAQDLMTEATGKKLDPQVFLTHLRNRYC